MEINISSTELNQGISYNYNEGDTIIVTGKEQIDKTGWQSLYYNGKVEKLTVEHSREYHLILNNGQKTIDYDIEHDEHYRPKIISISAPTVEIIGDSAFYTGCLKNISFPLVKSIGKNAFFHTTSLTELCLPSCITIGEDAFFDSALKRISLPAVKTI
jgi:hypothetical protein